MRAIYPFPVGPLLAYLGDRSARESAELLGVDERTVSRWRASVTAGAPIHLTERRADAAAVALGSMPWELWPDVWAARCWEVAA